jgi:hypothetical protein
MISRKPRRALAYAALLFFAGFTLDAEDAPIEESPDAATPAPDNAERFTGALEAGFEYDAYETVSGSGRWKNGETAYVDFSARRGSALSLSGKVEAPFTGEALSADDVFKELALSWAPSPILSLTAGKQRLKWGTARVFSSVDALAPPLDPLDPEGTDRGVTGLRADIIPTWWLSASALAVPAPTYPDQTTAAFRAEILAGETDLSLGAIRSVRQTGADPSDAEEQPAFFADFARFFDRFGVYGEAQISKKDDWEPSVTGGAQLDIPAWLNGTITLLGEYRWKPEIDDTEHMGYFCVSGIPITRKLSVSCSTLAAPVAKQTVYSVSARDEISQSMTVSLKYQYLQDWLGDDEALTPVFAADRHAITASLAAWY